MAEHTPSRSGSMISTADVNGTNVYSPTGEEVGYIDHLMIDKESGRVGCAVMNFGGFLGMGEDAHPVPWDKLSYDKGSQGFVTDITLEQLKGAPERSEVWQDDPTYRDDVYRY